MKNYSENDVIDWCGTIEDLKNKFKGSVKILSHTYIKFNCSQCNKEYVTNVHRVITKNNKFYCHGCLLKQSHIDKFGSEEEFQKIQLEKRTKTCLEKYGCENVYQSDIIKEKIKQTCLERYGMTSGGNTYEGRQKAKETYYKKTGYYMPSDNPEVKEKIKQTCLERYGVDNPNKSRIVREKTEKTCLEKYGGKSSLSNKEIREKSKKTMIEKYGVENPSQSEEIKRKKEETCFKHYGVKYPSQSEEVMSKYRQVCLEKYGMEYGLQSEEVKEKIRQTCLEKYGYEWTSLVPEIRAKQKSYCVVDGINFDSAWEVYVYYYYLKNNIPFEYQVPIKYIVNVNGIEKEHYYYCDFKRLDTDEYIEVKNPACLDENNNVIQLYKSGVSEEELLNRQIILDAKNKCMKENNVILLTDITFYKNWFKENCEDIIIEK